MDPQFYSIGRFAREAGVSIRTLRHYDQQGLPAPSRVSPAGYRLCAEADLPRLQQILALKYLGFSRAQEIRRGTRGGRAAAPTGACRRSSALSPSGALSPGSVRVAGTVLAVPDRMCQARPMAHAVVAASHRVAGGKGPLQVPAVQGQTQPSVIQASTRGRGCMARGAPAGHHGQKHVVVEQVGRHQQVGQQCDRPGPGGDASGGGGVAGPPPNGRGGKQRDGVEPGGQGIGTAPRTQCVDGEPAPVDHARQVQHGVGMRAPHLGARAASSAKASPSPARASVPRPRPRPRRPNRQHAPASGRRQGRQHERWRERFAGREHKSQRGGHVRPRRSARTVITQPRNSHALI